MQLCKKCSELPIKLELNPKEYDKLNDMKQILLMLILVGGVAGSRADLNREPKTDDLKPFVSRDGIGHVMTKIRSGKEIGVAYFGGSITQMDGWRRLTQEWLSKRYPQTRFREINAAIGGTGSDLGVFRVGKDVIAKNPDLVFVEFATNDSGKDPEGTLRNFDGIVRQIWANDPETDIVFVYTVTAKSVKHYLEGRRQPTAIEMEKIAEHYGIPSVDWGVEVARQQRTGKLVMSMGEAYTAMAPDIKNKDAEAIAMMKREGKTLFAKDGVHPALSGHEIYVSELVALWQAAETLPPVDHRIKGASACFSPRMERAKIVPINQSMLNDGWEPLQNLKEGNWDETQDGNHNQEPYFSSRAGKLWKAARAGATLTFRFQGNYCAIYDLLGPGCGIAEVTVDGKRMADVPRFDGYCSYYRLGSFVVFDGDEGLHEVKIVRSAKSPAKAQVKNRLPGTSREKYRPDDLLFGSIMIVGEMKDPVLRFGVLGDVHIDQRRFGEPDGGRSVARFRQALRILGARAVDGIVIAGDLTQDGSIAELKRLEATWREVFPKGCRFDGQPIERLFAFGDHDVEKPYYYLKYQPEILKDPWMIDYLTTNHIAYVDRAKVWKDVFGEEFAPIMRKTVKGYDFVLAHLVNADEDGLRYADPLHIPGLEEFFATNSFDQTKPFFYVQHKIPRGTVGGPYQTGQDSGRTSAILSRCPNAVGFNGHKHRAATEELSLWQGAFTQIQAPGLASLLTAAGRENGKCSCEAPCSTPPQQMEQLDGLADGHAMIVSVYPNRLLIERVDILHNGEPVAEPWTVPWPNDGSAAYEVRGKTAGVPRFGAEAKVSVATRRGKDRAGTETDQVVVSFPPALSTQATPRAYDYEVTAILSKGVVSRIVSQKRVYSPNCYYPEQYDTNDVVCVFGRAEIPDNHESVKFVVRPMNAWGAAGEPIESDPAAYWPKGALYPF